MRMGKAFLGAAMLAAAMAGPVQAKMAEVPAYNWSGFYIGGGGGVHWLDGDVDFDKSKSWELRKECRDYEYADGDHFWFKDYGECVAGTIKEFSHSFSTSTDLDGDPSLFGTFIVGIDWQSKRNPRIVAGAFVDIDFGNADADFTLTKNTCDCAYVIGDGELELDYLLTIGGRIGILSEDNTTLAYILAGYSHAEFDGSLNLYDHRRGVTTHLLPSEFNGGTIGGGVERKLSDRLSLRLEGRATFLRSESATFSKWTTDEYPIKVYAGDPIYQDDPIPLTAVAVIDKPTLYDCGTEIKCTQKVIVSEHHKEKTIDLEPDIFSFRAVLTYKFGGRHAMPEPLK